MFLFILKCFLIKEHISLHYKNFKYKPEHIRMGDLFFFCKNKLTYFKNKITSTIMLNYENNK